jgi:hypothetical protein
MAHLHRLSWRLKESAAHTLRLAVYNSIDPTGCASPSGDIRSRISRFGDCRKAIKEQAHHKPKNQRSFRSFGSHTSPLIGFLRQTTHRTKARAISRHFGPACCPFHQRRWLQNRTMSHCGRPKCEHEQAENQGNHGNSGGPFHGVPPALTGFASGTAQPLAKRAESLRLIGVTRCISTPHITKRSIYTASRAGGSSSNPEKRPG